MKEKIISKFVNLQPFTFCLLPPLPLIVTTTIIPNVRGDVFSEIAPPTGTQAFAPPPVATRLPPCRPFSRQGRSLVATPDPKPGSSSPSGIRHLESGIRPAPRIKLPFQRPASCHRWAAHPPQAHRRLRHAGTPRPAPSLPPRRWRADWPPHVPRRLAEGDGDTSGRTSGSGPTGPSGRMARSPTRPSRLRPAIRPGGSRPSRFG